MLAGLLPCSRSRIATVAVLAVLVLTGCSGPGDAGLAVGDNAPDFALPEASGSSVSLDEYAGSPALLYFHMADG